jgi:hypothetical protein
MMLLMIPPGLLLLTSLAASPTPPPARTVFWYDLGHRIVADIAERRLTPEAARAVRDLLGGQRMSDASVWADNIKQYRHDADPLPYIATIASDRQVLANNGASPLDRAEALRFLIHFMGDLHQPLHVADDNDRGGNRRVVWLEGDSMNLHQVWDGELLYHYGMDEATYLPRLERKMDTMDVAGLERGTVVDWAMEGHRIAIEHVYRIPPDGRLGAAYLEENKPIIDRALIAAGVRLAKVLNETLAAYRPLPGPAAAELGPGVYLDREAAAHLGETATVVGTVATVFHSPGGNIYLNFGADYPRQAFTAVALAPVAAWTARLDTLAGRRVRVHGRIVSYRGRLEIELKAQDQISVEPAR